jgi:hypothetical protein
MKAKWLWVVIFSLVFLFVVQVYTSHAQKTGRPLTLLYSNNINGELDPCPT